MCKKESNLLLYTHPNISDSSNYITNNVFLIFDLLKISVKESIFLSTYLSSSSMYLPSFFLCSITLLLIIWFLMISIKL